MGPEQSSIAQVCDNVASQKHATMSLRPNILFFGAMVVLVYTASLLWVFPGEFHPLTPHHPDMYEYVGLLSRPALEVASFPRPVTFLFYRTAGYLGVEHALALPI